MLHELSVAEKRVVEEWEPRIEELRLAHARDLAELQRGAEDYSVRRRFEADARYERMLADGELALARAAAHKETLEGAVLASVGGRLYLARQAAENLRIRGVTLDSRDPRVPSVLDLDGLVALLVGEAGEDD